MDDKTYCVCESEHLHSVLFQNNALVSLLERKKKAEPDVSQWPREKVK